MLKNLLVLLFLLAAAATAGPNEAIGTVISMESGDVFVVQIEESDPRIGE
jgi:hypothetical protein